MAPSLLFFRAGPKPISEHVWMRSHFPLYFELELLDCRSIASHFCVERFTLTLKSFGDKVMQSELLAQESKSLEDCFGIFGGLHTLGYTETARGFSA